MSTDERMEKMEGQLARIRWFNRCLIACIVLSLVVWFISKTFTPDTAWAGSGVKEIRANRFVVEDENGKRRVVLAVGKDGPGLALYDENDKRRVVLAVGKDGPGLALFDENDNSRIGLAVSKDGPGLALSDENGNPRVGLMASKYGPALELRDENRKVVWSAP